MLLVGLSWLFDWLLIDVFDVEIVKSVLVTAIALILLGLLLEYRDKLPLRRP